MVEDGAVLPYVVAIVIGLASGAIYFGGLWWSVRRLTNAVRPLRSYFRGLALRLGVAIGAFLSLIYLYDWPQVLAGLAGFATTRLLLIRRLGRTGTDETALQKTT